MNIIKVGDLSKTYKTYQRGSSLFEAFKSLFVRKTIIIEALKNVSFEVEEGEILGLLGPNGAGKSTTIKILTGVMTPSGGNANVLGFNPFKQRKQYVYNIGAVFGQKSQLIWDIPPLDSFEMNRAIYNINKNDFEKRLNEMTDMLDIADVIKKPTRQLSLGERMKCEFVMAMLHNPKIVFLDEPTIGIDIVAKEKIREFIQKQNKLGTTFILTTHDLADVEQLATRVIVVNHGQVVYNDNIGKLKGYFGNKKIIKITTEQKIEGFHIKIDGIKILNMDRILEKEIELELDTDILAINDFMSIINKSNIIKDINVSDLPIEEIIKEIYTV